MHFCLDGIIIVAEGGLVYVFRDIREFSPFFYFSTSSLFPSLNLDSPRPSLSRQMAPPPHFSARPRMGPIPPSLPSKGTI